MTADVGLDPDCVLCQAVASRKGIVDDTNSLVVGIEPRTPKRDGHVIFLPRQHLVQATASPATAGEAFRHAAYYAMVRGLDVDIESRFGGPHHLTVHVLPRVAS